MKKSFLLLMLFMFVPMVAGAHDFEVDGIYYNRYNDNAVVTYQGSSSSSYLNEYSGEVVIPETVTYNNINYTVTGIDEYAFHGCAELTNVVIPNTVRGIGFYAFAGCISLIDIVIPNSVTSISAHAFQYCTSLTNIQIPSSITFIGGGAFSGCSSITSIKVASDNEYFDSRNDCNAIIRKDFNLLITGCQNTVIPNTVEGIDSDAFHNCTGLTSIEFPESVKWIGDQAFQNCTGLTSVTIGDAVISIGADAFQNCTGLTSVTIGNSVSSFSNSMLRGCTNITSLNVKSGNTVYDSRSNCNAIIETATNTLLIGCQNTIIPSSITAISDAFYGCSGLTSITIPNSVTSIGGHAFYGCSGLTSITIPNSVTSIGSYAFYGCSGLTSITIPNSVTSIGGHAFEDCSSLRNATIGNGVDVLSEYAFSRCRGLTSVTIGSGVINIDHHAFQECTSLTSITIPNSVTTIGGYAFAGCSGLTSITIPNSVTSIGGYAFENCSSLRKIDIPNSVTNIYDWAFHSCTNLTNVTIGNGVTSIGKYTFFGCTGLMSVTIPNSVTSIGDGVFCVCRNLRNITIPNTVTTIGRSAFSETGITRLEIPNSVTSIGESAFSYCSNLANVSIPNSVTSIGNSVFYKSNNISTLIITGDGEWKGGTIHVSTDRLCIDSSITSLKGMEIAPRANVYCYAAIPPSCDANSFTSFYGTLHVPSTSLASYFTAEHWCDFANIVGDAVEPNGLTMSCDSIEVQLGGENYILTATLSPANATPNDVTWRSTNTSIASVYGGTVYANGAGECDIIAECLNKKAMCHVVVKDTTVTISLDKQEVNVLPNHIITLTPNASPVMPSGFAVTSSNPSVAVARVVNSKIQVVGIKEGTTVITVGSVDGNAIPDSCLVTVYTELGDVNCDGYVNISDVTDMIDHLLNSSDSNVSLVNADCDKDGMVNISDVTMLIDYLLGGVDLNPPAYEIFTVNGVSFKMVSVEGGTFTMGATEEQGDDANNNERPAHQVTLSDFSICETEVTQELWIAVMGSGGFWCSIDRGFTDIPNRPADCMNHRECQEFITKLNEMTGKNFRLPTEAEWEYAARGGNRSRGYKYSGSNSINEVAWYASNSSAVGNESPDYGTHSVGSKKPNELGLYDMSGNVCELVQDTYDSYSSYPQTNPVGHGSYSSHRVLRGGSWVTSAKGCRVSWRDWYESSNAPFNYGFRLAL